MHIAAEGLEKHFGQNAAVDGISFELTETVMMGVIGPSGAGKSTLLRLINRLLDADGGRLEVDGTDVLTLKGQEKRAWQSRCAMIFQQFNLVPRLDVATNVMLGRLHHRSLLPSLFNVFPDRDVERAVELLDRLGIAEQAPKRAEALSGGQQQRVAIARALMQDPSLILADEPIASLDPMNAQIVMEALRAIHEEDGRTVICNLHTLDTARRYCDRILGMRDGRVVFDGSADELTQAAAREIYGSQELDESTTSTAIGEDKPAEASMRTAAE